MAMKKKFLGLAVAAMVAIPATGVYAAPTITDIGNDNIKLEANGDTAEYEIPVTGYVTDDEGEKPQRIEVELPSKMAFTVNQDSSVTETDYTIRNRSTNTAIELSVGSFSGGLNTSNGEGNGIQLLSKSKFDTQTASNLFRNQISLTLANTDGQHEVDLGDYKTQPKLAKIEAGRNTVIKLKGKAGTKTSETAPGASNGTDVDSQGAQQDFDLVFSIKKVEQ